MSDISLLFVCSGNICRSAIAQGVMQYRLAREGMARQAFVDSAGTHGLHAGEPPDPRAVEMAKTHGCDISAQRARQFGYEDFDRFDLVIGMNEDHMHQLDKLAGRTGDPQSIREKLFPFIAFLDDTGIKGIPDPYYGSMADFQLVYDLIAKGVDTLAMRYKHGALP